MSSDVAGSLALDRTLISETIFRYHRSFDLKDWNTCRTFFTDWVEVETTGMEGSAAQVQNFAREKLLKILQRMGPADSASQHFSGNHIIEISGDDAVCIASSMARSARIEDGQQTVSVVGGWYTFSLVRTREGWKIRKFRFDQAWSDAHVRDSI
jgi:SnoaL-like domain